LGWVTLQRGLNNLRQWPQGPTSSYEIAHEKENPTLEKIRIRMNTEPLRVFIRTPTRSAREKRKAKPTSRDTYS